MNQKRNSQSSSMLNRMGISVSSIQCKNTQKSDAETSFNDLSKFSPLKGSSSKSRLRMLEFQVPRANLDLSSQQQQQQQMSFSQQQLYSSVSWQISSSESKTTSNLPGYMQQHEQQPGFTSSQPLLMSSVITTTNTRNQQQLSQQQLGQMLLNSSTNNQQNNYNNTSNSSSNLSLARNQTKYRSQSQQSKSVRSLENGLSSASKQIDNGQLLGVKILESRNIQSNNISSNTGQSHTDALFMQLCNQQANHHHSSNNTDSNLSELGLIPTCLRKQDSSPIQQQSEEQSYSSCSSPVKSYKLSKDDKGGSVVNNLLRQKATTEGREMIEILPFGQVSKMQQSINMMADQQQQQGEQFAQQQQQQLGLGSYSQSIILQSLTSSHKNSNEYTNSQEPYSQNPQDPQQCSQSSSSDADTVSTQSISAQPQKRGSVEQQQKQQLLYNNYQADNSSQSFIGSNVLQTTSAIQPSTQQQQFMPSSIPLFLSSSSNGITASSISKPLNTLPNTSSTTSLKYNRMEQVLLYIALSNYRDAMRVCEGINLEELNSYRDTQTATNEGNNSNNSIFHLLALRQDSTILFKYLDTRYQNIDFNLPNTPTLQTPLMLAALKGNADVCKYLLSHRSVDANSQDITGNTALHIACMCTQRKIVELLLGCRSLLSNTRNNDERLARELTSDSKIQQLFQKFRSVNLDGNALGVSQTLLAAAVTTTTTTTSGQDIGKAGGSGLGGNAIQAASVNVTLTQPVKDSSPPSDSSSIQNITPSQQIESSSNNNSSLLAGATNSQFQSPQQFQPPQRSHSNSAYASSISSSNTSKLLNLGSKTAQATQGVALSSSLTKNTIVTLKQPNNTSSDGATPNTSSTNRTTGTVISPYPCSPVLMSSSTKRNASPSNNAKTSVNGNTNMIQSAPSEYEVRGRYYSNFNPNNNPHNNNINAHTLTSTTNPGVVDAPSSPTKTQRDQQVLLSSSSNNNTAKNTLLNMNTTPMHGLKYTERSFMTPTSSNGQTTAVNPNSSSNNSSSKISSNIHLNQQNTNNNNNSYTNSPVLNSNQAHPPLLLQPSFGTTDGTLNLNNNNNYQTSQFAVAAAVQSNTISSNTTPVSDGMLLTSIIATPSTARNNPSSSNNGFIMTEADIEYAQSQHMQTSPQFEEDRNNNNNTYSATHNQKKKQSIPNIFGSGTHTLTYELSSSQSSHCHVATMPNQQSNSSNTISSNQSFPQAQYQQNSIGLSSPLPFNNLSETENILAGNATAAATSTNLISSPSRPTRAYVGAPAQSTTTAIFGNAVAQLGLAGSINKVSSPHTLNTNSIIKLLDTKQRSRSQNQAARIKSNIGLQQQQQQQQQQSQQQMSLQNQQQGIVSTSIPQSSQSPLLQSMHSSQKSKPSNFSQSYQQQPQPQQQQAQLPQKSQDDQQSRSDSNESANTSFKAAVNSAIQTERTTSTTGIPSATTTTVVSPVLQSTKGPSVSGTKPSTSAAVTTSSASSYGSPTPYHTKNSHTISRLKQTSAYGSPQTNQADKLYQQSSQQPHSQSALLKYLPKNTLPNNPNPPPPAGTSSSASITTSIPSFNTLPKVDSSLPIPSQQHGIEIYQLISHLGSGNYGDVFLVENINSKLKYAMKLLDKDKLIEKNMLRYAIAERNVMQKCSSPFIIKMYHSFQTPTHLVIVMEYCPGGDLYSSLLAAKRFPEELALKYLSEILLALEELHFHDVIYRDMKPENIVLAQDGHVKLIDFGLSRENMGEGVAQSFCGSAVYLAPEIISKKGHNKSVDWYQLGVLAYELLVGQPPFNQLNRKELYYHIQNKKVDYPQYLSNKAKSLITALLNKNPDERLGSGRSDAQSIKDHPFFETVNWFDVQQKIFEMPPQLNKSNPESSTSQQQKLLETLMAKGSLKLPQQLIDVPNWYYYDQSL